MIHLGHMPVEWFFMRDNAGHEGEAFAVPGLPGHDQPENVLELLCAAVEAA